MTLPFAVKGNKSLLPKVFLAERSEAERGRRRAGCKPVLSHAWRKDRYAPRTGHLLTPIEGKAREGSPAVASGAWWMNHGLDLDENFRGDFQAAAFRLDRK